MSLLGGFDQDTILWFIILFLLLFWCGNGCDNNCSRGCWLILGGKNMAELIKTATNSDIEALKRRQRIISVVMKIITYAFLIFMAFIVIFPFYWMIISSLKSFDEYHLLGEFQGQVIPTFFPTEILWDNYFLSLFGTRYLALCLEIPSLSVSCIENLNLTLVLVAIPLLGLSVGIILPNSSVPT